MKLRIKGNSIRMRLDQDEVTRIADGESVEVSTCFPGGQVLRYRFAGVAGDAPQADFDQGRLSVALPLATTLDWAGSDEVSMRAELSLANGDVLSLLVEKDFQCLVPRDGENQIGLYPNPEAGECAS